MGLLTENHRFVNTKQPCLKHGLYSSEQIKLIVHAHAHILPTGRRIYNYIQLSFLADFIQKIFLQAVLL